MCIFDIILVSNPSSMIISIKNGDGGFLLKKQNPFSVIKAIG